MAENTGSVVPSNFHLSRTITIIVGTGAEQKTFDVHEQLLTENSEYFKSAMQSNLAEAQSRLFRLDEDDADAFQLFVEYLYNIVEEERDWQGRLCDCAEAFALGDKLLAPKFMCRVYSWALCTLSRKQKDRVRLLEVPISSVLEAAEIIYDRVPATKGVRFRKLLWRYCAARLDKSSKLIKPWTWVEIRRLAKSHQYNLIANAMDRSGKGLSESCIINDLCRKADGKTHLSMYLSASLISVEKDFG